MSKILSLLEIIEGIILHYDLYFSTIFGEFTQTFKSIKNNIIARNADALALRPNMNLYKEIRYFRFAIDCVL